MAQQDFPLDHGGPVDRPFKRFPASTLENSIAQRFFAAAQDFASSLALSDGTRNLPYAELAALVDCIATATAAIAAPRPGPVAILLPSEVNYPAAMLGVLASGRGFVPLDPSNPDERNRLIAERAGVVAAICCDALLDRLRAFFPADLPVINVDAIDDVSGRRPLAAATADDLAFVVYTSGSAGTPKGALHSHRNLLHDVMQQTNTLHLNHTDRVALVYSPTVVGAIREIMMTLLNGASLHMRQEYINLRRLAPDYVINLRDRYQSARYTPRALIAYSANHPADRRQAERMAGLPNVELVSINHAQHNVIEPLIRNRDFMPLLERLVCPERQEQNWGGARRNGTQAPPQPSEVLAAGR